MPIPREEIEAQVRSITRTCKGPCVLSTEDQLVLRNMWQAIQDAGTMSAGLAMIEGLEVALKTGRLPIPEPTWEILFRRCAELIYLHTNDCNYDFNNIILSNPLDGSRHCEEFDSQGKLIADNRVTCPKCGTKIAYQAPNYTEV